MSLISLAAFIFVGAFAAAGVVLGGKKIYDYMDAQIEQWYKRNLQEAILTGLNFSINRYREADENNAEQLPATARSSVIGSTMAYIKAAVPDALRKFGMDLSTTEGRNRLQLIVEARIEPWMFAKPEKEDVRTELEKRADEEAQAKREELGAVH